MADDVSWDTPEWRANNVRVNRLLLSHFPELAPSYQAELAADEEFDEDGPHVVYSLVFYDFLERVLCTEREDSELFGRTIGFLRFLMEGPDPDYDLVNLAQVGVGEFLEGVELPEHAIRALPRGLLPDEWPPPRSRDDEEPRTPPPSPRLPG